MESDPKTANILLQIAILITLILINAFFTSSEMAVVPVNRNKMHRLSEQGDKNAALMERLTKDSTVFLSTIQMVVTLASSFSSVSATAGIAQVLAVRMTQWNLPYSQTLAGVVVTTILAYFSLVFGELVPKRITLQKAEAFGLFCVHPIYYTSRVMNPFIKLLFLPASDFLELIGMHNKDLKTDMSKEEIKSMLKTGSEAGVFNDIGEGMITSAFFFDDKKAKEVTVPRQDVVTLDINEPLEEFLGETLESMRSEIPVYEGEIDNTIGALSIKTLTIETRRTSFDKLDVRALLKPIYFVPEDRRTDALFREIQVSKIKLAILVDKYGGASDMMTLEDLIEEIVSDIHEEYEEEEPGLTELEPHKVYQVSGGITLFDLKEGMHLYVDSSCGTLSGYLMKQLGYMPSREQLLLTMVAPKADYEILEVEDRVIEWMRLIFKETKKEQEE